MEVYPVRPVTLELNGTLPLLLGRDVQHFYQLIPRETVFHAVPLPSHGEHRIIADTTGLLDPIALVDSPRRHEERLSVGETKMVSVLPGLSYGERALGL